MIIPDNLRELAEDVQHANKRWQEARESLAAAQSWLSDARSHDWPQQARWALDRLNECLDKEHKAAEDAVVALRRYSQAYDAAASAQTAENLL